MLALPAMTTVGDGAFLADDTMVAHVRAGGGWLRIAPARIGKRAFLGNSGMTAPGRSVPKRGLVGVLSAAPKKAKEGSSWLGHAADAAAPGGRGGDQSRTFDPPLRLKLARAAGRAVPDRAGDVHGALAVLVLAALALAGGSHGVVVAALLPPAPVLLAAGVVAGAVATAAKWLLVGRFRGGRAPAVELVRVAQRAGGHLRRGARRAVARRLRRRHAAAERVAARRSARGSAGACGGDLLAARGRPGHASATAPRSTAAACCRPTCSMIGS